MGTTGGLSLPERGCLLRWAVGQGTPERSIRLGSVHLACLWAPSSPPPFPALPPAFQTPSPDQLFHLQNILGTWPLCSTFPTLARFPSFVSSLSSEHLPFTSPCPSWPNILRWLALPSRQSRALDQCLLVQAPLGHSPHPYAHVTAALACWVCEMGRFVQVATLPEPHSMEGNSAFALLTGMH